MRALTLDLADRKETYFLLDRLSPPARIEFLRWCCRRASGVGGNAVGVTSHSGSTWEAYQDLMLLEFQHGLDLQAALEELVRRVRRVRP